MGPQKFEGEGGVADGPTREGLHGDEGETHFLGEGEECLRSSRFYEIERELDGDELSRGDGLQSRGDAVGRDADEPDLPLPPGFQRAEFLLEKGAIDMIVDRRQMRDEIAQLLAKLLKQAPPAVDQPA